MNKAGKVQKDNSTLFDQDEWASVQSLLARISSTQKLWLSGYLAAQPTPEPLDQGTRSSPGTGVGILIAHGGETGNSESLARMLRERCLESGLSCRIIDLAQAKVRHLVKEKYLLIICSTHGEGDPPETINDFYHQLSQAATGSLATLEYAVLALGDSSYEHFCKAGRDLDEFLARAGATRIAPREEVDVDFSGTAPRWIDQILESLSAKLEGHATPIVNVEAAESSDSQDKVTKANPGTAELLEKTWLSDNRRENGYWHVELLVEGLPEFRPGDALGIFAENPDLLIDTVLNSIALDHECQVNYQGRNCAIREVLKHHVDLVVPSKSFLARYSEWSGEKRLLDIAAGDAESQRKFLKNNQVVDLLSQFPSTVVADDFVKSLRPLQPRLYDITNCPGAQDDELHLLVKKYRYSFNSRVETGIASRYFQVLAKGMGIRYYVHTNKKFHLPDDASVPLILIAHGSGLGPFRSFIQSFRESGANPPCWVIFLEKTFEDDFLYQLEWQQALADGLLSRFDGLFDGDHQISRLSNFLYQNRKALLDWIGRQAHFYLCGDREILKASEADLNCVLESLVGKSAEGDSLWQQLELAGQVHRNYY